MDLSKLFQCAVTCERFRNAALCSCKTGYQFVKSP